MNGVGLFQLSKSNSMRGKIIIVYDFGEQMLIIGRNGVGVYGYEPKTITGVDLV